MTNTYNPQHPHERERGLPPILDEEGRCLRCGCEWRDEQIERLAARVVELETALREPSAATREYVAICFHSHYERLAPEFGYETRTESAVPWSQVPEANRELMGAVAGHVLRDLADRLVGVPVPEEEQ